MVARGGGLAYANLAQTSSIYYMAILSLLVGVNFGLCVAVTYFAIKLKCKEKLPSHDLDMV